MIRGYRTRSSWFFIALIIERDGLSKNVQDAQHCLEVPMQPLSEDRQILLSAVPRAVEQRTGNRPHISTIHRWVQRGVRGIKLQTIFSGGHRRTTPRFLQQFFSQIQIARDGRENRPASQETWVKPSLVTSRRASSSSHEDAVQHLENEGL